MLGTGTPASAHPAYLSLYDKCLEDYTTYGEPMAKITYKTAEECYNANIDSRPMIVDACNLAQTPPSTTKAGKMNKSECKLNISNCTRTCGKDQTAYYLTKDDENFGFRKDGLITGDFPTLVGGCHRFLDDEIAMISYSLCVENGNKLEEYKNLDECCSAKGGCSDYESFNSPIWRIDQCNKANPTASAKGNMFETDHLTAVNYKRCPTFLSCEQCIDDLSTQFPDTPVDALVGENTTSGLDIKSLLEYTLVQSGVMTVGGDSDLGAHVGECKPCIDHLVAKYTVPAFLLDKVESTSSGPEETQQQSYLNSFFNNLLDEVVALKRVSEINLMYLYDYFTTYYSDEYLSAQNQQGVRRTTGRRAIDFKTGC